MRLAVSMLLLFISAQLIAQEPANLKKGYAAEGYDVVAYFSNQAIEGTKTYTAEHKGIKSNVAGMADLLLLPDIEAGNVLYKAFIFFANAKVAANILGASAPIVLTSRSDSEDSKLDSICLAAAVH